MNIREVVDTVFGYHLPQAEQARLQVYIDIPASMPWDIVGERARLICILDHLISNAVKFTPAGSVTVKVPLVLELPFAELMYRRCHSLSFIQVRPENEAMVVGNRRFVDFAFDIVDTGVGISPNELDKLFRLFSQVHRTSAESGSTSTSASTSAMVHQVDGLGLGVVVAERLMQRWQGRSIKVTSLGVGHGSTFSFVVPLRINSNKFFLAPLHGHSQHSSLDGTNAASRNGNAAGLLASGPLNVLIVDDDPLSARTIMQSCNALKVEAERVSFDGMTVQHCRLMESGKHRQ